MSRCRRNVVERLERQILKIKEDIEGWKFEIGTGIKPPHYKRQLQDKIDLAEDKLVTWEEQRRRELAKGC